MTISYRWLLEYLPEPVELDELTRILTSIGLEVEGTEAVESIPGGLAGLVTGHVLTCAKHPNADKLSVTTVDTGTGAPLKIVCGAPNVAAGQKVVVAPVGATVHPTTGTPFLIKKAKIRGEDSEGMICAEDEIGLGESHAGILVLPEDTPVGIAARSYFNLPETDHAIHIGLTPNRSDANSHIGVARDVCTYLSYHRVSAYRVKMPETVRLPEIPDLTISPISVTIEEPLACPRYAGIGISHVVVGPSPDWLKDRLQAIGIRSINNIVDITNFVLHEFGQPLHAFDADCIADGQIVVGFVPEGTVFTGLDEKERKLSASDLMIKDTRGALAIGGVFGGLHSGINDKTTRIFLESAYFNPAFIRRTSLQTGLRTDAATHFEKGVDIHNVLPALERAAALICSVAGGMVSSGIVDVYAAPLAPVRVHVSYSYIRKLSGKEYPRSAVHTILEAAGFTLEEPDSETLIVTIPSNKTDITAPADIVEEILRIDGLDNIQIPQRLNMALGSPIPDDRKEREQVARTLAGAGMMEIVTNSIVNSKYYPDRNDLVRMINSLSSELDVMRPSLLESGLEVVQFNCNRKSQDLALFEFGNVYTASGEGAYNQASQLGIWMTGRYRQASWAHKEEPASLFHLKGVIRNLLVSGGIRKYKLEYLNEDGLPAIRWVWKGATLAVAYEVSPQKLRSFEVKQPVFFGYVDWTTWLLARAAGKVSFRELPKYPSVQRDIALVLDKEVTYSQVEEVTDRLGLEALESYALFDIFESEKLGKGKKSFALNYVFQVYDRTLTDQETEAMMKKMMDAYKAKLGAQIRE